MIDSHLTFPFPFTTSTDQPKSILDDILTNTPSTNDHTVNIYLIPSSIDAESKVKYMTFENCMAMFGSSQPGLEAFMIDGADSVGTISASYFWSTNLSCFSINHLFNLSTWLCLLKLFTFWYIVQCMYHYIIFLHNCVRIYDHPGIRLMDHYHELDLKIHK